MLLFISSTAQKWYVGMLLMSASLLSPATLPEELKFPRRAMKKTADEPSDKAMEKEFLQILRTHQRIIDKICYLYSNNRVDQLDLFQEISFHLWRSFPSFRKESEAGTWLYRIALRTAVISYRSKRSKIELWSELPDLPAPENTTSMEELITALRTSDPLDRAIAALVMEGYGRKEIASIAGVNEETVKKRLSRLKKRNQNNTL